VERERPAPASRPFAYHLAVRAGLRDTDAMGHVNNAVYLTWLEEVRTRYVLDRTGGGRLSDLGFVLAAAELAFRAPVYFEETVDLWVAPCRIGRTSWDLLYEARAREGGRLVLEARTVQVQYDYSLKKPVPIPEDWRHWLEKDRIEPDGSRP